MEKGDRSASPPRPDHLRDPSGFSAKKQKKSTHIRHTQAPSPQHQHPPPLRNRDSCIQILNRTSNVPGTHTSAHAHTSSHRHTLTPTHNGTLVLSHPYIPSTYNTYSQAGHAHVLAPGAPSPHTHRCFHTEHGRTWPAPKHTRRPSHTKHALTLITQTLSCQTPTRHVHPAPTSQHSLPTPLPPPQTAPASHMTQLRCTHKAPKRHPHVHTYEAGGAPLRYTSPSPQCSQSLALSPSSQCPLALCKDPQHRGTRSCGGQQSAPPHPRHV